MSAEMIEQLQAKVNAADWCHPGGACYVRESLEQARGEASSGRVGEVRRLLNLVRRKLDLEWWWWSRGGSDWPPDRPAGERRPADQWLALDADCTAWALAVEIEKKATPGGKSTGCRDGSSRSDFTGGLGFSE
jgi:hypothetical protein